MNQSDIILSIIENSPKTVIVGVAERVKQRRLERALTQKELAKRAGIPLPTYRRFERTGEISFSSLVLLGMALGMTAEFGELFNTKTYSGIDDLLRQSKKRKRGKRNG
jgi:transcriptional regulator with XRE-family HTH domain